MSQFESPFGAPEAQSPKTSGLAVTALVCSLIFFCPLTTLLGPILGLIALVAIGANPARKGKGLAAAAILIGLALTIGWGIGGYWVGGKFKDMFNAMMSGPDAALVAGFAGDIPGFQDGFYAPGPTTAEADAVLFIGELRTRYGDYMSCAMDESTQPPQPGFGQTTMVLPYKITFSGAIVDAECEMVFADQATGQMVFKPGYLTIFDAERGDLTYPPARATAPAAPAMEPTPSEQPGDDT